MCIRDRDYVVKKGINKDIEGDVKYHLGASSNREFDGNSVHISVTDNPSHLEAVNPVVLGQVRAKQFFHKDKERKKVIAILIHGDAAFAGQGVVAECFAMSGFCLLYTSPSPRDGLLSRMPSSA